MPPALREARVRERLEHLRLRQRAVALGRACADASQASASYLDFLDQLLAEEEAARAQRTIESKTRLARLPSHKTMTDFDYAFQPGLDKRQIAELLTLRFLDQAENVLLPGPPGVGTTHIAVAPALEAIRRGATAYFVTLRRLIERLAGGAEGIGGEMRVPLRPKLRVLDEVGYLPLDQQAAAWLFELVSRRHERGSIILTSNKSYGDWASLFPDVAIASAILDRLLHHSTTITLRGGHSYRLKDKRRAGLVRPTDQASNE